MLRAIAFLMLGALMAGCATTGGAPASQTGAAAPGNASSPQYALSDIEGKTAAELDQLLGAPALARSEGSGEFRRYTLTQCALLVVLFPGEDGVKRAAKVDAGALKSDEEKPELKQCLAAGKPRTN